MTFNVFMVFFDIFTSKYGWELIIFLSEKLQLVKDVMQHLYLKKKLMGMTYYPPLK
jgi:hypothetical protein